MRAQRVVVVGAGIGGLRSVEQLRAAGFAGEVVVVGAEPHLPYDRPPLSKAALAAGPTHETVALPRPSTVDDTEWRLDEPAVAADLAGGWVTLAGGGELGFDGLVIATGLRSRRLPVPGPSAGRYALRTLDDAIALRAVLGPGVQVVVVGAGFVGCEVAATARGLGAEVTVIAPEVVPMELALGRRLGGELRRRHERHGTTFRLGVGVVAFTGADAADGVELTTGETVGADVVVEAVGSAPNVDWLAGSGVDTSDGVLCDNALRVVGRPRAVAVGDVARFPNPLFGPAPARVEHWAMPTHTARRAAGSLAAELAGLAPADTPFTPLPTFWSDQYGLRLQSMGRPELGLADVRLLAGELADEAVLGYHRDGQLVGVAGLARSAVVLRHRPTLMAALS